LIVLIDPDLQDREQKTLTDTVRSLNETVGDRGKGGKYAIFEAGSILGDREFASNGERSTEEFSRVPYL
jgi:hypothetical protein